ncbi:Geraniol 8-hydroxylase-like protein [Drosera capensis]
MEFWNFLLYLSLTLLSIHFMYAVIKRSSLSSRRLPPGPLPLPLVGNILKLGTKAHVSLAELAKVYGPVMNLELGLVNTIVISSADMAKEVLKKNDASFSYRAHFDAMTPYDHNNRSIAISQPGPKWRGMRRLCAAHVFSNSKLDASHDIRRKKVDELLLMLGDCSRGQVVVNIGQAVFNTTLSSMSWIFFSKGIADGITESGQEFKELVRRLIETGGEPNIVDFFPQFSLLRMMDVQGIRRRAGMLDKKLMDLFDSLIQDRLEKGKTIGLAEETDVLDSLLCDIHQGNDREVELSDLPHMFLDLFLAGLDTTTSTVEWAMAELLRNHEKLKLAQSELEDVIGKENPIQEADIGRLPYLQAIIKETLRLHPPLPFLVPRAVLADVTLGIYTVPKEARVFVNTWAMGRDPTVWPHPSSFEPERFIDSEVDFRGRDFELIPFGAGRRMCPGLPLASRMLHLVVGSLIHSFDWKLEDGVSPETLDMEEKIGFTLQRARPLFAIPIRR